MRQLTITIPSDLRTEAEGDLQVLVRDYGDEGTALVTADCQPSRGAIWRPVELVEEYIK